LKRYLDALTSPFGGTRGAIMQIGILAALALKGAKGKRLTYREPPAGRAGAWNDH